MEDVDLGEFFSISSGVIVHITCSGVHDSYTLNDGSIEFFGLLDTYSKYIKVNVYYTQKGDEKVIVDYKIYLKSNNEEITCVNIIAEFRGKIVFCWNIYYCINASWN